MEGVTFCNLPGIGTVTFHLGGNTMMVDVDGKRGAFRDVLPRLYPAEPCALSVCQKAHSLAEDVLRRQSGRISKVEHLRSFALRKKGLAALPIGETVPEIALRMQFLGLDVAGWQGTSGDFISVNGKTWRLVDFDPFAHGDEFTGWSLFIASELVWTFCTMQRFGHGTARFVGRVLTAEAA